MTGVLLATDADWIFDEVDAALNDDETTVHRVRAGLEVVHACNSVGPDVVVIDLQIGNMGGMASCMSIRHEETAGRLPTTRVLLLLDRAADVFLAQRCNADGWLIKPFDSFRLRRAVRAVLAGGTWTEGVPDDAEVATSAGGPPAASPAGG